jgi:hypothetical protein
MKAVSFFYNIRNDIISITEAPLHQFFISVEGRGKNQLQPSQDSRGYVP